MMLANSFVTLRQYDETSHYSVAAVRMLVENPVNEGKTILIVEGNDDREVYKRFVNTATVEIYADGDCDKHSEILSALNLHYSSRLAAIKDADYDHLNGTASPFSNMYLTDFHDLEGMILAEGFPSSVRNKYKDRMEGYTVNDIMHELEGISYLKWFNSLQEHNRLRFKGLRWADFYGEDFVIQIEHLFDRAKANTGNVITWTLTDVDTFTKQHPDQDLKQLCRGHDIFECLYIRAKSADSKHNFSKKLFFADLRNSYSLAQLSTELIPFSQLSTL